MGHPVLGLTLKTFQERHFEIRMPGARPTKHDDYLCSAFSIKNMTRGNAGGNQKKVYVTAFNAEATASKAHHLILQGRRYSVLS